MVKIRNLQTPEANSLTALVPGVFRRPTQRSVVAVDPSARSLAS